MSISYKASWALRWYVLAVAVIVLDLWTKSLASSQLDHGLQVEVFSWFNLTLHHNSGAAFSFLSDAGGWQRYFFSVTALLVSAVLMIWIYRLPRSSYLLGVSLALVLGGALGNLWDRVTLGYVVDFISLHYGNIYYFPAFNLADSAITVGAMGLILDSFSYSRLEQEQKEDRQ